MEFWVLTAVVIVLATLGIDRSRAYRVLPAAVIGFAGGGPEPERHLPRGRGDRGGGLTEEGKDAEVITTALIPGRPAPRYSEPLTSA